MNGAGVPCHPHWVQGNLDLACRNTHWHGTDDGMAPSTHVATHQLFDRDRHVKRLFTPFIGQDDSKMNLRFTRAGRNL